MTAALGAFHLLRPWWLLLLVPALLLWRLDRRGSDTTLNWRRVIDPVLLRELTLPGERTSFLSPGDVLFAAWIVAALALSGPSWRREPSPFADAQPPVMIVLRVTPSMQTTDLLPSRLERAKEKIADLLKLREGASTGLVVYSGSAHLVLPSTPDRQVVMSMVEALSPDILPRQGDRLVDAVRIAASVLEQDRRGGSILVMADTVAPDQIGALASLGKERGHPPVILLAMAPAERVEADGSPRRAAEALGGLLVETSIDQTDVDRIATRIESASSPGDVAGEGEHWRDMGYWLTPLIAIIVAAWFRRGWLVAA